LNHGSEAKLNEPGPTVSSTGSLGRDAPKSGSVMLTSSLVDHGPRRRQAAWSYLSKIATLDHQLAEEVSVADSDLFQKGLKKRKQVLGEKYVDANLAGSDEFMMTFQRAVTELAWGYAWSRPGLDQKTRSLLTLGILGGLGRFQELGIYVNAALASGATVDEIKEALVQITVYCGTPSGRQAFLAAHDALKPSKE
jgi:4-carboxymuconolactone decarboxylase